MVAAMMLGSMPGMQAIAQTDPAQSTAGKVHFAVPAGGLVEALDALARQGNIQVVYTPALVAGKTTPGLSGDYSPVQALGRLLRGTGLTWRVVNASTFILRMDPQPPGRDGSRHSTRTRTPAPDPQREPTTLATVTVSGSLINNAQIQTATPTFTITRQQIQDRGFTDLQDVLQNSVFSVGAVDGPSRSASFTQSAETFSFFGLPPGFTLILVDGKPLANYGELYQGNSTFNNVGNIPTSIIDHIDVMPGGSSSIYGSSAIAGVVNIVTRSRFEGVALSARIGAYSDGGGGNQRATITFGHDTGKFSVLGSFEFGNNDPVWGYQRDRTSGSGAAPTGPLVPNYVRKLIDYGNGPKPGRQIGFISPPNGCGAVSSLFGGTTIETTDPSHPDYTGTYCGSLYEDGYRTFASGSRHYDGRLKVRYNLNPDTQLYADLMANYQRVRFVQDPPHWDSDFGIEPSKYIEDANTHEIFIPWMHFGPEELPGGMYGPARAFTENNLLFAGDVGAAGRFGQSNWLWNAYFMHNSDRTVYNHPLWLTDVVNQYFMQRFLGPMVGIDPVTHLGMYDPNYDAYFEPISPADSASLIYNVHGFAKSWINNTRFLVSNASLFALKGGDAGLAALVEGGSEAWYEPADPAMATGNVWGNAATSGGGRRQHQAAAFELNLPLFKQLTADLSGREDRYTTPGGTDNDKFTWKFGVEYRPVDTLLIRGNYATSFKAPDMAGVFLGPSTGFQSVTDYYECTVAGAANCDGFRQSVLVTNRGNVNLRPTTARNWTVGAIWAPTARLSMGADFLSIRIRNETILQSTDLLMRQDAQCRLGQLDPSSPDCLMLIAPATGQVSRDQFGNVDAITAVYANLSSESVNAVNAHAEYSFTTERFGNFAFRLAYNDILKHTSQEFPSSPVNDELSDPKFNVGFKSVVNGSVSWEPNARWRTTLYWHRYGATPNYKATHSGSAAPGAGSVGPWITYNWSLDYFPARNIRFSLRANNLFNRMPPVDPTYASYPYYNTKLYNTLGRMVMVEADFRFGGNAGRQ